MSGSSRGGGGGLVAGADSAMIGDQAFRSTDTRGRLPEMTYGGALSFLRRRYTRDIADADTAAQVPGGISMLDDAPETVSAALKYLGYSITEVIESGNEEAVREAGALLKATNDRLVKYDSVTYADDLVNGEVDVAHGWSGGFAQSLAEADAYETHVYTIPAEGGVRWVDTMAIPHNADNVCSAHAMINFLTDAENGGALTNYNYYGSPNAASTPFILDEILDDPGIYPPPDVYARLELIPQMGGLIVQDMLTEAKS